VAGLSQTDKVKIQFTTDNVTPTVADAIVDTATENTVTGNYIAGTASAEFLFFNDLSGLPDWNFAGYSPPPVATGPISAEYQLSSTITNGVGDEITIKRASSNAPAGNTIEVLAWGPYSYTIPGTPDTTTGEDINNFQIGPDSSDNFDVNLPNLSNDSLNINNINVSTRAGAESALTSLDTSINQISQSRTTVGAQINRLESILNTSMVAKENYTAAQSRIKDADMAAELIEYTKLQIFNQTGLALSAQANKTLQNQILSILI